MPMNAITQANATAQTALGCLRSEGSAVIQGSSDELFQRGQRGLQAGPVVVRERAQSLVEHGGAGRAPAGEPLAARVGQVDEDGARVGGVGRAALQAVALEA